ncbi:unnamed protein product [Durusdinium trenchii]
MKAINLYASACKRGCHEAYYFMHGVVRQVLETLDSGVVVCEPEGFALDEAQSNACFEERRDVPLVEEEARQESPGSDPGLAERNVEIPKYNQIVMEEDAWKDCKFSKTTWQAAHSHRSTCVC